MAKRFQLTTLVLVLVFTTGAVGGELRPFPPQTWPLTGEDPPAAKLPKYSPSGVITMSPGVIVGSTQADYQSNGSTGRQMAKAPDGGVEFTWMNYVSYPSNRYVFYNYIDRDGYWVFPGVGNPVSFRQGAGYPQIDTKSSGEGVIVYHHAPTGAESLYCAVEMFPGIGQWDYFRIPNRFGSTKLLWPHITDDNGGNLQLIATQGGSSVGVLGYTRSTNGGQNWSTLARVDTLNTISAIIVSSPVSNKVSIIYTHPTDTSVSWKSDVYYIESPSGLTWDFANNKINITEYGGGGDSLFAWKEVAAVYDYNDNLHIIWTAQYVVDTGFHYNCQLLHFDEASGMISPIYQFNPTWPDAGCDITSIYMGINSISLVTDTSSGLIACFASFDSSDCSAGGYANGDIYMTYSVDNGVYWLPKYNITNSHTPDCLPGFCDSDVWLTLAEHADTNFHLFYMSDRDAGYSALDQTDITDNPMLYLAYRSPLIDGSGLCDYITGDINGSGQLDLSDIIYGVQYLKGMEWPPYRCLCTSGHMWYVAGDVNADCKFNGIDISYLVNYFKGGAGPRSCPSCPPVQ